MRPRPHDLLLSTLVFCTVASCHRGGPDPGPAEVAPVEAPARQAQAASLAKAAKKPGPSTTQPVGKMLDAAPEVVRPLSAVTGPVALSSIEGGAILVSTSPGQGGGTEIDMRRMGTTGKAIGPTRVLHRVPGKIRQIGAVPVIDRSAVVWCSENDKGALFFGMLWLNDWGGVEGKVDLGTEDHAPCHFSLLRETRAAVLVHMTGKKEPCPSAADSGKEELCPSLVVHRLTPTANPLVITDFRLEHHRSAADVKEGAAGDAEILFSAVSTDRSILITANVQSITHRQQVQAILLPDQSEQGTDTMLPQAQHESLMWAGDRAVIVGHTQRSKNKKEAQGSHATVWLANRLGGDTNGRDEWSDSPWPRITKTALRCADRGLRIELSGERGLHVTLDPQSEGQSFVLSEALGLVSGASYGAALWTGDTLLTWDRAGSLVGRPCENGTIDLNAPGKPSGV